MFRSVVFWISVFKRHAFSDRKIVSACTVRIGVLIFEDALISSSSLGNPSVTFLAEFPAWWNVLSVICVVGSPTDCAAITPTISPGATIDLYHFLVKISTTFCRDSVLHWCCVSVARAYMWYNWFCLTILSRGVTIRRVSSGVATGFEAYLSKRRLQGMGTAHFSPNWYGLKEWYCSHAVSNSGHCLLDGAWVVSSKGHVTISWHIPSIPSSPYKNCMTRFCESRTDVSFATWIDSKDLTRRLCMYPVAEVLTAVSTRPSRPPTVWFQYSSGVRPSI